MNEIYLDNAATTKPSQEVVLAMMPYLFDLYGNPSSIYEIGIENKEAVNKAQDCVWTEQINMMAKKLSGDLSAQKIIVTGQPGEPVNFELHEVIQVSGTTDQTRDGLVERVIENGYMKDGRVLKKAKVSAYRI